MSCSHMPIQSFFRSLHSLEIHFTAGIAGLYIIQAVFSLCVRSKVLKFSLEMENVCFFHLATFKSSFFLCSSDTCLCVCLCE